MRILGLKGIVLVAAAGAAIAGSWWLPRSPLQAAKDADPRLDAVLREWRKASQPVKQAHFRFKRTERSTFPEETRVVKGEAWVGKPDLLRVDEFDDKGKPVQMFLFKNREIRHYVGGRETVCPLTEEFGYPKEPGRYPKDSWRDLFCRGGFYGAILEQLAEMFGDGPSANLTTDFHVRLEKEDDFWTYLAVTPKTPRQMPDFEYKQFIVARKGRWLRRVYLQSASRNVVIWDLEEPETKPAQPITPESIAEGLPVAWERITIPRDPLFRPTTQPAPPMKKP